jgi:hypothetical protein
MATPKIEKKIVNGVEVDVKVYPMVDPRVAEEAKRKREAAKEIAEREAKEKK